jgi:formylmethanofuran dehydrogenase subunit E
MRLIDADELQQIFNEVSTALMREPELLKDIEHMVRAFLMTTEMIKDAPTIEAEPVKHEVWLPHKITASVKCSNCRRVSPDETPYCPHCGARMDG